MSNAAELLARLRALGVQLTLEGDVLRLNAPKGALTPELQAELKASKPDLLDLLRSMQQNAGNSFAGPMPRAERKQLMPLSFAQQRIWFLQQMDPESTANNLLSVMRMKGELDGDILEQSLQRIILRHEALQTTFVQRDGTPYTVIGDGTNWKLKRLPMDARDGETLLDAVTRFAQETTQKPFDLEVGPLLVAYLLNVSDDENVLVISLHHIISDGWSMGVLIQELSENYRALALNEKPRLSELPVQYVDYTEWQRNWMDRGVLDRQARYWTKQLKDAPAVVLFPPDHPRTPQGVGRGKRSRVIFSVELTARLEAFSRANDATLFMTMLSAFMLMLARYSGQKGVVVGSPSANRNRSELSELIGFFVNNLVLRTEVADGISFLDLLKRVRETTLGAFEHQDLPFDHLVREMHLDRNADYSPLFQTMFILQNFALEEPKLPKVKVLPFEIDAATARFDLTAEIYPYKKELWVYFDYRADLYDDATILDLQKSFEHVLEQVVENPHTPVEFISLLSNEARESLLAFGNDTARELPPESSLIHALRRFAEHEPEKIAVRAGKQSLTYAQIHRNSDELALRLKAAGAGKGSLVPVCLSRSIDLLTALLAVLKTGAAYVPLDPIYPKQRIASILDDARPSVMITERSLLSLMSEYSQQCILLNDASSISPEQSYRSKVDELALPEPDDLAYVIFTSGSTGRPKGVEISHGALANFLDSMSRAPGFSNADRILAVTTVSFDIAGLELFLPIYVGGEIVISLAPGDLPTLLEDLAEAKPTVMQATPALWEMLVRSGWQGDTSLTALCGGEALTPELATALLSRVKALWNMYGPTETTIWSTALQIEAASGTSVPIGGPIQNTTLYVLDPLQEPVPLGVAGELYIGGAGLARGYLNRPELTADRFITPKFSGQRLYRTGDLVRRRRDGRIEFLGRADFQVKLRGFRIELGEIEHAIRQQPEVSECVVLLREDAEQKDLVAYLVLRSVESFSYAAMRQRLRERIPEYMVPSSCVVLDKFPRLPNGKLDRSKLAASQPVATQPLEHAADRAADRAADQATGQPTHRAGNQTEAAISRVFCDLLHTDRIGLDQRFFDLGAHSLLLVKAHDRLRKELDSELRLVSFFQYPSISALAAHIDRRRVVEGEIVHAGQR